MAAEAVTRSREDQSLELIFRAGEGRDIAFEGLGGWGLKTRQLLPHLPGLVLQSSPAAREKSTYRMTRASLLQRLCGRHLSTQGPLLSTTSDHNHICVTNEPQGPQDPSQRGHSWHFPTSTPGPSQTFQELGGSRVCWKNSIQTCVKANVCRVTLQPVGLRLGGDTPQCPPIFLAEALGALSGGLLGLCSHGPQKLSNLPFSFSFFPASVCLLSHSCSLGLSPK